MFSRSAITAGGTDSTPGAATAARGTSTSAAEAKREPFGALADGTPITLKGSEDQSDDD